MLDLLEIIQLSMEDKKIEKRSSDEYLQESMVQSPTVTHSFCLPNIVGWDRPLMILLQPGLRFL